MCVCVWEGGGQGGELINQKPPAPSRRKLAGEACREGGWEEGKMALEDSRPFACSRNLMAHAPQAGPCRVGRGGAELSTLEGLESLHAKGCSWGSRGEKWAGQRATSPHLSASWNELPEAGGTVSIHWARQNVTEGERTLSCGSGSQLCPGGQEGRTRVASSFLTEPPSSYAGPIGKAAVDRSQEHRVLPVSLGAQGGRKERGERGTRSTSLGGLCRPEPLPRRAQRQMY